MVIKKIKLGDIVKIAKGKKAISLSHIQNEQCVRFIQIDDLRNNNNVKFTEDKGVHVKKDDLIIAWDGANAGTIGYGLSGVIGSTLAKLEITNTDFLPSFLGKLLQGQFRYLRDKCTGATIPHISKKILTEINIPCLSLSEQKRIVRELDAADALRQKRKQTIALLDDYLKAVFLEMFGDPVDNPKGWQIKKFGEIIEDIRYGSSEKSANSQSDSSIPILRIPNILNGYVNYNDLKFQILATKEEQTLTLNTGDILFVRTNGNPEYIGRCAVFDDEMKCVFASYLIRARLKKDSEFNPFFIRYCLSMDSYRGKIRKESRTTAGNYNINTKGIKNFDLISPPKELQDKFIAVMIYVEKFCQSMNLQFIALDMNFNALMQRAFNQT